MNIMELGKFKAKIEYDSDDDMFRGEILGLSGGADFYGKNPNELRKEFKKSLDVYLEVCKEKCIEPLKNYSGIFNLRISPELHEKISIHAGGEGKSLNQWVESACKEKFPLEHPLKIAAKKRGKVAAKKRSTFKGKPV